MKYDNLRDKSLIHINAIRLSVTELSVAESDDSENYADIILKYQKSYYFFISVEFSVMHFQFLSIVFALSVTSSIVSGKQVIRRREIKINRTLPTLNKYTSHINFYSPRPNKPNELDTIYNEKNCKNCITCMVKAREARIATLKTESKHNSVEVNNAIISNDGENKIREKRNTKLKEHKGKKQKKSKTVAVTKYNRDGKVNVLKVKETPLDETQSTCNVYSVTKYYTCQSPEGASLLASVKKTKSKRDKTMSTSTKTENPYPGPTALHKKRDTSNLSYDNSQIPDNVMPSFEEYV
ncbi:hypothetical protein O0L34_g15448 [Tuta absoluta]|nr:hypothetical protein O0L34_g15448 [Tuta absoluta]